MICQAIKFQETTHKKNYKKYYELALSLCVRALANSCDLLQLFYLYCYYICFIWANTRYEAVYLAIIHRSSAINDSSISNVYVCVHVRAEGKNGDTKCSNE